MKLARFDPPANNDDFVGNAALLKKWSDHMSSLVDSSVASVRAFLAGQGGGVPQFYNPVTHGRADPDLPPATGTITWNGFPKGFDTLTRRILRRGIPFGPPFTAHAARGDGERGLHFLCYQTSIEEQFEKLQSDWANSDNNPRPGGYDLIIGQDREEPRDLELLTADGASVQLRAERQFVLPSGGGYFFSP
jgi:hypothetical protein